MNRGDRIELIRMGDDPHPLEPGSCGTVTFVDALGTIHVKWDNGRTLGLLPNEGDEYRLLPPEPQSIYTLAVTRQPVGTPTDELFYDEVDVFAPSYASLSSVLRSADLEALGYSGCRVVGVLDQSSGTVLAEAWNGDLLPPEPQEVRS